MFVGLVKLQQVVEKPLDPGRFTAAEMAFAYLYPHNFTAACDMEAAFCSFMCLKFRHLNCFLFLYLFSLRFGGRRSQDYVHSPAFHLGLTLHGGGLGQSVRHSLEQSQT